MTVNIGDGRVSLRTKLGRIPPGTYWSIAIGVLVLAGLGCTGPSLSEVDAMIADSNAVLGEELAREFDSRLENRLALLADVLRHEQASALDERSASQREVIAELLAQFRIAVLTDIEEIRSDISEAFGLAGTVDGRTIDAVCQVDYRMNTLSAMFELLLQYIEGNYVSPDEIRALGSGLEITADYDAEVSEICAFRNGEWGLQ